MMMPPVRRIKKAFVFEYVPAIPTREREREGKRGWASAAGLLQGGGGGEDWLTVIVADVEG
jgi:hypothetical protein